MTSMTIALFLLSEHKFPLPHPSNSPPCHCSPDTSLLPRRPLPTPASSPPPCSLALPRSSSTTSSVCLNRATLIQPPPSGLHRCPRHAPGPLEVIPDETTPSHNTKKVPSRIKKPPPRLNLLQSVDRTLSHSAVTFSSAQLLLPLRAPLGPKLIIFLPHRATTPVHSHFTNPSAVTPPSHRPPP